MVYPLAPTTLEDLVRLIPQRGVIAKYRFITDGKPFELRIGRNSMNIVCLEFCSPDGKATFWPRVRTVESLTSQRAVWSHWQKFLEEPDMYLTWEYIGNSTA